MKLWQIIALFAIELILGIVAGLTWGSIGSGICIFGMLLVPCVTLWQRYLNNSRNSDYFDNDNGT